MKDESGVSTGGLAGDSTGLEEDYIDALSRQVECCSSASDSSSDDQSEEEIDLFNMELDAYSSDDEQNGNSPFKSGFGPKT